MNWGYRIMLIIGLFLAMLLYFVYIASQQKNELMDSNYYKEEIEFQQKIDASNRLDQIYNKPLISQEQGNVLIKIPTQLAQHLKDGKIELIHYNEHEADLHLAFVPDSSGTQIFPSSLFKTKGQYKCRIQWRDDSGKYYREEDLQL
ncbi:MAG: FixH family protein [Saprospiraceae bacterium]